MNANEVKQAVAALVDENHLQNEAAFYAALNQASLELATLSPLTEPVVLSYTKDTSRFSVNGGWEDFCFFSKESLSDLSLVWDSPLTVSKNGAPCAYAVDGIGEGSEPLLCRPEGVYVKKGAYGLYRLLLPRLPDTLSPESPENAEAPLALRDHLLPLLPLLTAHYYAMEEELDKKDEFFARYNDLLAQIKKHPVVAGGDRVINLSGW